MMLSLHLSSIKYLYTGFERNESHQTVLDVAAKSAAVPVHLCPAGRSLAVLLFGCTQSCRLVS